MAAYLKGQRPSGEVTIKHILVYQNNVDRVGS